MFLFCFYGCRVGKLHVYLVNNIGQANLWEGSQCNGRKKREAKKLRHLGSLRAHFHLPPIHATTTTLTSNSYQGHSDHNIYMTTSDQL